MTVTLRRRTGVTMSSLDNRIVRVIERYYQQAGELYVTAGTNGRHAAGSYHYRGMAVDLGSYDDTAESRAQNQADMDKLALWIFDNFWDLTLELIHCAPSLPQRTYVKNQRKVAPYDAAAHVNHIHWATSAALMDRIELRAAARWAPKASGSVPFPLPAGHYYGPVFAQFEHTGSRVEERPAVKMIQSKVGLTGSSVDGLYGSNTAGKVRLWQAERGLVHDGLVGPVTWHKMFGA